VFDECQLFRQPPLGIGAMGGTLRVALAQLGAAQLGERLRRRGAIGTAEIGKAYPRSRVRSNARQRCAMAKLLATASGQSLNSATTSSSGRK